MNALVVSKLNKSWFWTMVTHGPAAKKAVQEVMSRAIAIMRPSRYGIFLKISINNKVPNISSYSVFALAI